MTHMINLGGKAAMAAVLAMLLCGCTTLGQAPTPSPVAAPAGQTSPLAVDADIQRILTAGGIPADDPVVAALQTPPAAQSAWGENGAPTVQTAAVPAATISQSPVLPATQTAAVQQPLAPGAVGVENIDTLDVLPSLPPAPGASPLPSSLAALPAQTGLQPAIDTFSGATSDFTNGGLPPSMVAGILPMPTFSPQNVTVITGPDAAPDVAVVAPARSRVVPFPKPRPTWLSAGGASVAAYVAPAPAPSVVEQIAAVPPALAPVSSAVSATELLPLPTVKRF